MVSMDNLPDQIVWEIFSRITYRFDRDSISLTCKRFRNLDNEQRKYIRVGCGLNPANEALTSLCHRFPNLNKVEIVYSSRMSKFGKQLEDQGLFVLSNTCPFLTDLTLSYCTFITDAGLSCLASCSKLSSLKLYFTPRITGCGLFSIVVGCKNLMVLHLIGCLKISNLEWIECLGRLETLEDLYIKNCRGIGEDDLVKLGPTWRKIKRLQFDANFLSKKVDHWQNSWLPCEGIVELSLMNCIISQRRGLGRLLDKCKNLRKVNFDMCFGPRDSNIIGLAKNSTNLRSISIRVRLLNIPLLMENPPRLTDESLKALAQNCKFLESVTLSFSDPSLSSFSLDGILRLIKTCPLKELSLDHVSCFNNVGMEALCFAEYLETLELARCREISDEGIRLLTRYPRLRVLKLTKCVGVTDYGFRPLIGLRKLEVVDVNDCPLVSRRGIQGTARFVSFKQDLSLMY